MGGSYISGLQKIAQIISVLQEGAPSGVHLVKYDQTLFVGLAFDP